MPKRPPPLEKNSKEPPDTKVEVTGGELEVKEEKGFYEAYKGFANNLRTWFLAYGIGAPVVLLSNEDSWSLISNSGSADTSQPPRAIWGASKKKEAISLCGALQGRWAFCEMCSVVGFELCGVV